MMSSGGQAGGGGSGDPGDHDRDNDERFNKDLGLPWNEVLRAKQRQAEELQKAEDYLYKIEVDNQDKGIFRKSS